MLFLFCYNVWNKIIIYIKLFLYVGKLNNCLRNGELYITKNKKISEKYIEFTKK